MSPRALLRIVGLILLFLVCAPPHMLSKLLLGRSTWPLRFLAAAARIAGARVRVEGAAAAPHSLLIVNHTSWLDILILGGATDCAFVSKDQLGHGFVHWLADQSATVYVKRSHARGARDQAVTIARALEGDRPVALFPEGTTGPGTHLLAFRSTLLEAANFAAKDVAIRPVALDYGAVAAELAWFEEPALANALRVLGRRGTFAVTVRLLAPLERSGNRKQLAAGARTAIADSLGFKLDAHSPIAADR